MAIAISSTTEHQTINTTDALWALIVNQKKSVQKTLASRLTSLLADEKRKAQETYVRETLTHALSEVRESYASGKSLPDANHLFDDFDD